MIFNTDQMEQINSNSLYRTIGMQVLSAEDGRAVSELKPVDNVCWPLPEQPHGGILFTQMDTTMAWAAISASGEGGNCATISMEIQYPTPARGKIFVCETRVMHKTWRSCFMNGKTSDEEGNLVAMSQATFRIIQPTQKR